MSDDFTINFTGLTELQGKLDEVRAKYPFKEEEILQKLGKDLRTSIKEKTPVSKNKTSKHLKNSYKLSKVDFGNAVTEITLTSKSPHFHLIEAGHNIVRGKGGAATGFVPGKHMAETSLKEMEQTLPITVGVWLDGVLGEVK